MSGTSLVHQLDAAKSLKRPRSPDSKNEVYVRKTYVRKPYVRVEPIVTHSEPREIAGHVSRRENRVTAALPPPASKPKLAGRGAGGDREQDGKETEERNKNTDDDDEDDGDENEEGDNDEQQVESQQSHEESDDDFASAASSPWPEEIWNDAPSEEVLAALDSLVQGEVALGDKASALTRQDRMESFSTVEDRLEEAKQEAEFRKQENLNGPGWQKYSGTKFGMGVYQLFAEGDYVLRYTHPPPGKKINAATGERMDIEALGGAGWVKAWESSAAEIHTWGLRNETGCLETMASLPAMLEDIPLLTSSALRDICSQDN